MENKLIALLKIALSSFARKYNTHYTAIEIASPEKIQRHRFLAEYSAEQIKAALYDLKADQSMQFCDHILTIEPIPLFFSGLKAVQSFYNVGISAMFADVCGDYLRLIVGDSADIALVRKGCVKFVEKYYTKDFYLRNQAFMKNSDPKYIADHYREFCMAKYPANEEKAEKLFCEVLHRCAVPIVGLGSAVKE